MDLKEKVKSLPSSPGVYLMKDSLNTVIYVGKSKNLKSRVGSYFQNSKHHSPKVVKMVGNIKDFDYILTDTEFEAFMLECRLIHEIKPPYNKMMKNPLSYTYIVININERYPSIDVSSEPAPGSLCFGPYNSRNTAERGIQGIREHLRILCNKSSKKTSRCINYELGLCIGICTKNNLEKEYMNIIDRIICLLNGTDRSILNEIEQKMDLAAQRFDFEAAAKYRDYANAISYLVNKGEVIEFAEANQNIVMLEDINEGFKFFLIKGNRILFTEKYTMHDLDELKPILINNILFYFSDGEAAVKITRDEVDEAQIIYSYLKSCYSCRFTLIPQEWISNKLYESINSALDSLLIK